MNYREVGVILVLDASEHPASRAVNWKSDGSTGVEMVLDVKMGKFVMVLLFHLHYFFDSGEKNAQEKRNSLFKGHGSSLVVR